MNTFTPKVNFYFENGGRYDTRSNINKREKLLNFLCVFCCQNVNKSLDHTTIEARPHNPSTGETANQYY